MWMQGTCTIYRSLVATGFRRPATRKVRDTHTSHSQLAWNQRFSTVSEKWPRTQEIYNDFWEHRWTQIGFEIHYNNLGKLYSILQWVLGTQLWNSSSLENKAICFQLFGFPARWPMMAHDLNSNWSHDQHNDKSTKNNGDIPAREACRPGRNVFQKFAISL